MERMDLSSFLAWHNQVPNREYVFATVNQRNDFDDVRVSVRFDKVLVHPEIRQIFFGSGKNYLVFDRVKEVQMYDDMNGFAAVFDIICGEGDTRPYRILSF